MSTAEDARSPNRLLHETSPYLRQHAYNPVDWHPWGDEAFELARRLEKPIFLSVGYSSCHWCHVMERESFEDDEIARVMNEHFVNVKVDREERPDVDAVYMTAVQMFTGQGGWPMSVFLTPDLRPFWGGTYFPPRARYGRPGFQEVLHSVSRAYNESRGDVERAANAAFERLSHAEDYGSGELPGEDVLELAAEDAARRFDALYGGFGPAPKFPRSVEISMLFRAYAAKPNTRVLEMCARTLDGMAHGGLYDQIGGGFHRYSTDARWLVPHFEKMLYDNALLARTYLEAFQLTGTDLYGRIARETLDYVLRDMTHPEGGFYSATDADSEGKEGAFFVWTPEELEAVLGRDDGRLAAEYYNVTVGGNFEESKSILHVTRPIEDVARAFGLDREEAFRRIEAGRRRLFEAREEREKPFRDEKVLTAWNGLMISAFARGAQVFGVPRHREAAEKAAELVLERLRDGEGRLLRVLKDGEARVLAFLDDYAFFIEALLDLYETVFDRRYLREARRLADFVLERFRDGERGGFFYTSDQHEKVISRRKDPFDGATPAPAGVMALDLLRLERLTGVASYRERAEEVVRSVSGAIPQMPMAFGSTLIAIDFLIHAPVEIAVAGDLEAERTARLLERVHSGFLPERVIAAASSADPSLADEVPLLRGKSPCDGLPAAYVCRDASCQPPVTEPDALARLLPFVTPKKG